MRVPNTATPFSGALMYLKQPLPTLKTAYLLAAELILATK